MALVVYRTCSSSMVAAALTVLLLGLGQALGKDLGGGWNEKKKPDGKVVQEMKVEAPTMTEEDQYGYNMPEQYRCDSCKAIIFHLNEVLQKAQPKSRKLKAWEYADLFDETCKGPAFEGYGIKSIGNGQNALSGPGLKVEEALAPGGATIQMGGDSWKKRLAEICRTVIFEKVGEDEFYEKFRSNNNELPLSLCHEEAEQCNYKPPTKDQAEEKAKKKEEKERKSKAEKAEKKADKAKKAAAAKKKASEKAAKEEKKKKEDSKAPGGSEDRIDVQTFLRSQALQDGLTSDEYMRSRSEKEWEQLIVAMAGRLFNRKSKTEL